MSGIRHGEIDAARDVGFPDPASLNGRPMPAAEWKTKLQRRLLISDAVALTLAFGLAGLYFSLGEAVPFSRLSYLWIGPLIGCVWYAALGWTRSRDVLVLGSGVDEFRRVRDAVVAPFILSSIIALWAKLPIARGYLLIAFLAGFILLVVSRYFWRRRLWAWRSGGDAITRVIVLGGDNATLSLADSLKKDQSGATRIVGVCIPGYRGDSRQQLNVEHGPIPVLGDENSLLYALARTGADTVAITATEALGHEHIRELGWQLNDLGINLVIAPGILDVASPRMRIAPAGGTALIHVQRPKYRGASRLGKVLFDRLGALAISVIALPVLIACALAVRFTSRGPIFYVAPRVGAQGRIFPMVKFRTMVVGADQLKDSLADVNDGAGPLFKMRDDPRITRVGKFLRRTSLDELPQLLNVLVGQMSLVGPRPHLEMEVQTYSTAAQRRMLLKPGMTGLWQVSGRSDLSWDESLRLDLSYVENWSFMLDTYILLQTMRAVVSRSGAY